VDDATRANMHVRLDKILDRRGQVEPVHPLNSLAALLPTIPVDGDPVASNVLFREGVELLRDVLGESVRATALQRRFTSDDEQRRILRGWVNLLWPLLHVTPSTVLGIAPQQELSVFEVLDALSALDAGEIRPLFVANTGKNRRANRWSLARAKLEALAWKKRLVALGHSEKDASYQVTVAFGEQWDTIRKWKRQCEQILGSDQGRHGDELRRKSK
jgi:hypothetical protein